MVPAAESFNEEVTISRCITERGYTVNIKHILVKQRQSTIGQWYVIHKSSEKITRKARVSLTKLHRVQVICCKEKKTFTTRTGTEWGREKEQVLNIFRFRRCELEVWLPYFQPGRFSQLCCRLHSCAFLSWQKQRLFQAWHGETLLLDGVERDWLPCFA